MIKEDKAYCLNFTDDTDVIVEKDGSALEIRIMNIAEDVIDIKLEAPIENWEFVKDLVISYVEYQFNKKLEFNKMFDIKPAHYSSNN